jgi:hypothetical protein
MYRTGDRCTSIETMTVSLYLFIHASCDCEPDPNPVPDGPSSFPFRSPPPLRSRIHLLPSSFNFASSFRVNSTCGMSTTARKNASAERLAQIMNTILNPRWYAGMRTLRTSVAASAERVDRYIWGLVRRMLISAGVKVRFVVGSVPAAWALAWKVEREESARLFLEV